MSTNMIIQVERKSIFKTIIYENLQKIENRNSSQSFKDI